MDGSRQPPEMAEKRKSECMALTFPNTPSAWYARNCFAVRREFPGPPRGFAPVSLQAADNTLRQVNPIEAFFGDAGRFNIADPAIRRDFFRHKRVCIKDDFRPAAPGRLRLGEFKQHA